MMNGGTDHRKENKMNLDHDKVRIIEHPVFNANLINALRGDMVAAAAHIVAIRELMISLKVWVDKNKFHESIREVESLCNQALLDMDLVDFIPEHYHKELP